MGKSGEDKFWYYIPIFCVAGWFLYSIYQENHRKEITPRDKNGTDTIYTNDSAYVIKFKIDTVFEIQKEHEPIERP